MTGPTTPAEDAEEAYYNALGDLQGAIIMVRYARAWGWDSDRIARLEVRRRQARAEVDRLERVWKDALKAEMRQLARPS